MSDQKETIQKGLRQNLTYLIISVAAFFWLHAARAEKDISLLLDIFYFISPIMAIVFLVLLIINIRKYLKNSQDDDLIDELLD